MKEKLKKCKTCDKEIARKAAVCPHCGAKNRKLFFKRWCFWLPVCLILLALIQYFIFGIDQDSKNSHLSLRENDSSVAETTEVWRKPKPGQQNLPEQ